MLLASLMAATPAGAASETADYVSRINSLRASVGVPPLQVDSELTAGAAAWAEHMASTGVLAHSPSLSAGITQHWVKVGENVGVGPDVASIFSAFVSSAAHYQNLVDPAFNRVGVGVAFGSGHQWTCHRFMDVTGGGSPSPAPAPTPTPKPGPAALAPRPSPTTTTTPAAPVPAPPPPPPTGPPPPADSSRVATVLSALRVLTS
ncbi:MAG TPA: CAP domain-containing protein [Acidimicrobiales bacterium]